MNIIILSLIVIGAVGLVAALLLYFTAQKFHVDENPLIDEVDEILPGANCGGCGFPGCRKFAETCVAADSLKGLFCPVGGNECMTQIAESLGMEVIKEKPKVAVLACNGTCDNRPKNNQFDGASSCKIAHSLYGGETGCTFGCLGLGDCEDVCQFDALHVNPATGLPEIDDDKCTACNACVTACPKGILELRPKGPKKRRIYVACQNEDKGAIARKACKVACIGCKKCVAVCPFDAITVVNNLAYIDPEKCKLCRKCVAVCPTGAIRELNFPPKKEVKPAAPSVAAASKLKKEASQPAPKQDTTGNLSTK